MSDDQRGRPHFLLSLRRKPHPGIRQASPDAPNLVEKVKAFIKSKRPPSRQSLSLVDSSTVRTASSSSKDGELPPYCGLGPLTDQRLVTAPKSEKPSTSFKNIAKAGASFTQLLLTRLPDFLEPNPVKLVFGLARVVIEITKEVQGNMDSADERIASISKQLSAIEEELYNWETRDDTKDKVAAFGRSIQRELKYLQELKAQSTLKQIALVEDNKGVLTDIFERVNEARIQLQLRVEFRTLKMVDRIEGSIEVLLLDRLKPSNIACHDFHGEGEEHQALRRVVCAPETRTRQLGNITRWANNLEGEDLYWLYGPAGAGKSTIAYTIARRFESHIDTSDNIVLGGSFFCSRQFSEAKYATRIVQTLAYQLAIKCKPFGRALATASKAFDLTRHTVREQIKLLLADPWQESRHERSQPPPTTSQYLLVIDALDELEGDGGYLFLCALVDAIQSRKLMGLKFLATSRPEPRLVDHVESFAMKQVFRLQDVPIEEAISDVDVYLQTSLPELSGTAALRQLAELAEGSFILAATVAKQILGGDYSPQEQLETLVELLDSLSRRQERLPVSLEGDTFALDKLYLQVLEDAFNKLNPKIRKKRLLILHTLLCSTEPISPTTLATLINGYSEDRVDRDAVEKLVARLYSVLYVQGGNILFYHKSFPDFMLNQYRSGSLWWCDQPKYHQQLARACFQSMTNDLRFNIAEIPSSYILDRNNLELPASINIRIPTYLSYACRHWDQHVCQSPSSEANTFVQQITIFLRLHVLFWIEVMNLLKMSDLCGRKLGGVREYIGDHSKELAQNLSEVASFATYFSSTPASASTPHLYISALATWPRDTPISRNWRKHFPRIPTFINPPLFMPLVTVQPNDNVRCFCFAENNQELVFGTDDGLRIWDLGPGTWSKRWSKQSTLGNMAIRSMALSTTGDRICSGGNDGTINIWDTANGSRILALRGHDGPVESLRFVGADNSRIVSSSSVDVRVWDVSNGEELASLDTRPFDPPRDWLKPDVPNAISSDGRHVAAAHQWGVYLWDLHTGKSLWVRHTADRRDVCSLAVSDNTTRVAAGLVRPIESQEAPGLTVWTSDDEHPVFIRTPGEEGEGASVWDLRFLGDTRIAWTSASRAVGISDAVTGEALISLTAPNADIGATSITLTFDHSRMASRSPDGFIRVWDLWGIEGAITERRRDDGGKGRGAVYGCSQDFRFLASKTEELVVWDLLAGESAKLVPADYGLDIPSWPVGPIAISRDGGIVALAGVGLLKLGMKDLLRIDFGFNVGTLAFSKDGTHLVASSQQAAAEETTVLVLDISGGHRLVEELKLPGDHHVVISQDGDLVVSVSREGEIRRDGFDAVTRKWNPIGSAKLEKFPKPTTENPTRFITSASLSGDGRRVVMSFTGDPPRMLRGLGKDKRWDRVHVWDVSNGRRLLSLHGGLEFQVNHDALALSDDGSLLVLGFIAAAFKGHAFEIWDVGQKKITRTLGWGVHRWVSAGDVVRVSFSPDGDHLISGQTNGVARLWTLKPPVYARQRVGPRGASTVPAALEERRLQRLDQDFEKEFEDNEMSGWLVSPAADLDPHYLMYTPLHTRVPHSSLLRDLPSSFARVDLEHAALGAEWTKCYEQSFALQN